MLSIGTVLLLLGAASAVALQRHPEWTRPPRPETPLISGKAIRTWALVAAVFGALTLLIGVVRGTSDSSTTWIWFASLVVAVTASVVLAYRRPQTLDMEVDPRS